MKKILPLLILFVVIYSSTALACHIKVHAYDGTNDNDLEGVQVTLSPDSSGWIYPDTQFTTNSYGNTNYWRVAYYNTYYTATGVKEGYSCDVVQQQYTCCDTETWQMPCYPIHDSPEFTTIGSALALAGAGLYMFRKRSRK